MDSPDDPVTVMLRRSAGRIDPGSAPLASIIRRARRTRITAVFAGVVATAAVLAGGALVSSQINAGHELARPGGTVKPDQAILNAATTISARNDDPHPDEISYVTTTGPAAARFVGTGSTAAGSEQVILAIVHGRFHLQQHPAGITPARFTKIAVIIDARSHQVLTWASGARGQNLSTLGDVTTCTFRRGTHRGQSRCTTT